MPGGKGSCFVHATEAEEDEAIAVRLTTSEKIRTLQRKLYDKAKQKRMPYDEEHRKAVCGKTACTV